MKAKDLIRVLQNYSDNTEIYIKTYDDDFDTCEIISDSEIILQTNQYLKEQSDDEPFEPVTDVYDAMCINTQERDINLYIII